MSRYKLTLEYDGTGYRGWQIQKNARSIQGTLIQAAQQLFGQDIDLQGAGRTDAGVHAMGQVAHLDTAREIPPHKILTGLNDLLPSNINLLSVEKVHARFHARHHALSRTYVYLISTYRTAFGKRYVWWVRDTLNIRTMQAAGLIFRGFHDFVSFADKRFDKDVSTRVKMDAVEVACRDNLIILRFSASHFLWKMVRRIAGVLVEAGRGNLTLSNVERMLSQFSDVPAKWTAPPSGLFLMQVLYEGDRAEPVRIPFLLTPVKGNSQMRSV